MENKILKIKIHQPDAHYRVPFSYQRRFTYPIPPFSTVKGLLCNVMGITNENDKNFNELKKGLSLAIYGNYETMVREYIWFRNLKKESHISKFTSVTNRIVDGTPQHPGGQMPVTIDVLHSVDVTIYIYHPTMLDEIKSTFEKPTKRASILHLGRSEDWIVIKEVEKISIGKGTIRSLPLFCWVPSFNDLAAPEEGNATENFRGDYETFFSQINGNLFKLPLFYEISEDNKRTFTKFIDVKLFEKGSIKANKFLIDESEKIPLFFAKMEN